MKSIVISLMSLLFAANASASSTPATAPAKLWATDFAAFATANPRGRWIVAQSPSPAISADEAEASARTCAVETLLPQVRSRLSGRFDTKELRRIVDGAIRTDGWIVDRHVHADQRPYGTIWRESILVDTSSRKLDDLAKRINTISHRERKRKAVIAGGGLVLSVIASLGFLILNWLTRGYLRTRLAFISFGIVLVGVAVIVGLTPL